MVGTGEPGFEHRCISIKHTNPIPFRFRDQKQGFRGFIGKECRMLQAADCPKNSELTLTLF